jgi:hypothetical protein
MINSKDEIERSLLVPIQNTIEHVKAMLATMEKMHREIAEQYLKNKNVMSVIAEDLMNSQKKLNPYERQISKDYLKPALEENPSPTYKALRDQKQQEQQKVQAKKGLGQNVKEEVKEQRSSPKLGKH